MKLNIFINIDEGISVESIEFTKAVIWNERLSKCIERYKIDHGKNGKLSLERIAQDFESKYGDRLPKHIGQTDISKWQNVRTRCGSGNPFPSPTLMIYIADFFEVDLGYLLGETDSKTFQMEDAVSFMGLTEEALQKIRLATSYESAFHAVQMSNFEARKIMSALFESKSFFALISEMQRFDFAYSDPGLSDNIWNKLEKKHAAALLNRAFDFDPYENEDFKREDDPELVDAYLDVKDAIDKRHDHDEMNALIMEAQRYRITRQFSELVEELYPTSKA